MIDHMLDQLHDDNVARLREREEAEICALASNVEVVNSYRIEWPGITETLYWNGLEWHVSEAHIYTEAERETSLAQTVRGEDNGFPAGGIWVRIPTATIECNGCPAVETLKGSARELAEHVYTLKRWMIYHGEPLCYSCQGFSGPVSDDDVRADERYEELYK